MTEENKTENEDSTVTLNTKLQQLTKARKTAERTLRVEEAKADQGIDNKEAYNDAVTMVAEFDVEIADVKAAMEQDYLKEQEIKAQQFRTEIQQEAQQINIDLGWLDAAGDEYACRQIGSILQNLQCTNVSGEGWYETQYGNTLDHGSGPADSAMPEFHIAAEDRFEALRAERHYTEVLRAAFEMEYDARIVNVDTSMMTYPPVKYRQTDQQVRNDVAKRRAARIEARAKEQINMRGQLRSTLLLQEGKVI